MAEAITFNTMTYQVNEKGIAIITVDVKDQRMNILTPELHRDTGKIAERLKDDVNATGAIICSGKSSFVAGGDLKRLVGSYELECTAAEVYERVSVFSKALRKLETCGKPVAAIINGTALGGGLELALACHYRVVADDDGIALGLPETTVGLMPGAGGTQRLPRLIGIEEATSLILSGRHINPAEALELGIIDKVVSAKKMFSQAERWLLEESDSVQPWDKKGFQIPGGGGLSNMKIAKYFQNMTTQVAVETKYNYPAPIMALKSIFKGTSVLSIDTALQIESRYFSVLSRDVVARNMIRTLFLNKGLLDRLQDRPREIDKKNFETVALIGGYAHTEKLASRCDSAGINVILYGSHDEQWLTKLPHSLSITITNKSVDLSDVELLIILPEVEFSVMLEAINAIPTTAIVANGADWQVMNNITNAGVESERVIGWYPFFLSKKKPVEIVREDYTAEKTLAHVMDFTQQLRMIPIIQKSTSLRFSQACIHAYIGQGLKMLVQGLDPILIENIALNSGMKLGPLAMADTIGLEQLLPLLADQDSYKLVFQMIDKLGRTGKDHGKGFYNYSTGDGQVIWHGMRDILFVSDTQPDYEKIKQRLLCIQALSASRYWENGSIAATDADVISVLGWGFPSYTGGTLSYIDTMGVNNFLDLCRRLASECGELFHPSEQLVEYARHSDRIYQKVA